MIGTSIVLWCCEYTSLHSWTEHHTGNPGHEDTILLVGTEGLCKNQASKTQFAVLHRNSVNVRQCAANWIENSVTSVKILAYQNKEPSILDSIASFSPGCSKTAVIVVDRKDNPRRPFISIIMINSHVWSEIIFDVWTYPWTALMCTNLCAPLHAVAIQHLAQLLFILWYLFKSGRLAV